MSEQPRNWDRELADIDKVIAKGSVPGAGGSVPVPAGRGPGVSMGAPVPRRSVALTWFWVALALALAVALPLWPYEQGCGLRLMFFMGAAGVTTLVGLLGALASWSHRRAFAHVLSLGVIVWAAGVGLREVLPRVGYAKVTRTWTCVAAPAQPVQQTPAQRPAPTQIAPAPQQATTPE
ncbi:MAG: hypothetical protein ABJC36_01915 [Gemmatimonadales bacterium]